MVLRSIALTELGVQAQTAFPFQKVMVWPAQEACPRASGWALAAQPCCVSEDIPRVGPIPWTLKLVALVESDLSCQPTMESVV